SNIARLFRAYPDKDTKTGVYGFYIPGVATYFKEIGDDGGSTLGLLGGYKGEERLKWASDQFDQALKVHIARANNPANAIVEINIAAFGFSRGAALARAFIHRFVEKRCKEDTGGHWRLMPGGYRLRIRFMGLFDTVASVGPTMSTNNTSKVGALSGSLKYVIHSRLQDTSYALTRPERLAFSKHGQVLADPAPGSFNGHSDWGNDMRIPEMVEEVRHFVAAHEIRNSFPVESLSIMENGAISKPAHFFEIVYPGVHSDVGGSYRPGEGARSQNSADKIGLIPLSDMYKAAVAKGVPFVPTTAWTEYNVSDFEIYPQTINIHNYYLSQVVAPATLGGLFNAHMAIYYAWRFRAIHLKQKGDHSEADTVKKNEAIFQRDSKALDKEIALLEQENNAALKKLGIARMDRQRYINSQYGNPDVQKGLPPYNQKISDAQREQDLTQDKLLRAKAKKDALPGAGLQEHLDFYDAQLLADADAIRKVCQSLPVGSTIIDPTIRQELRPHYRALLSAYENEFIYNKGLKDVKVIDFFDHYVHDSLAGFAKDATLPSDPRVIYLGGNEKYKYARTEDGNRSMPTQEVSVLA
ncbi:MAG: DUF2235 domain-containing protein, partial [Burkholderiales bacterium]|nr:DUF2235 domain-containing protein [Burkholderiales bacterium]